MSASGSGGAGGDAGASGNASGSGNVSGDAGASGSGGAGGDTGASGNAGGGADAGSDAGTSGGDDAGAPYLGSCTTLIGDDNRVDITDSWSAINELGVYWVDSADVAYLSFSSHDGSVTKTFDFVVYRSADEAGPNLQITDDLIVVQNKADGYAVYDTDGNQLANALPAGFSSSPWAFGDTLTLSDSAGNYWSWAPPADPVLEMNAADVPAGLYAYAENADSWTFFGDGGLSYWAAAKGTTSFRKLWLNVPDNMGIYTHAEQLTADALLFNVCPTDGTFPCKGDLRVRLSDGQAIELYDAIAALPAPADCPASNTVTPAAYLPSLYGYLYGDQYVYYANGGIFAVTITATGVAAPTRLSATLKPSGYKPWLQPRVWAGTLYVAEPTANGTGIYRYPGKVLP